MSVQKLSDQKVQTRQQLRRARRRNRFKRRLIVFLFLFLCVGVIFTVLKAPFFNVKSIVCVGQENLTEEDIIKAAEAKLGVNIFSTNISAMKHRLAEVPEISESNVRRLFPNKLKIWVREAKKAGYIKLSRGFALIDLNGKIVSLVGDDGDESVSALAEVTGLKTVSETAGQRITAEDDMKAEKIFECMRIMDRLGMLPKMKRINASDLSDIKLDYENRLNIYLGSYDNMEYKLTFIKKVIDKNISEYERADLDYRGKQLYVGPRTDEAADESTESETSEDNNVQDETKKGDSAEDENKQS